MAPEGLLAFGDENEIVKQIRDALEVGPYDKVVAITPQFERIDGKIIKVMPRDAAHLDKLKKLSRDILLRIGLQMWNEEDGKVLYLFPEEWYDCIPDGYIVTDIFWEDEPFRKGKMDNDIRCGALAYGFARTLEYEATNG